MDFSKGFGSVSVQVYGRIALPHSLEIWSDCVTSCHQPNMSAGDPCQCHSGAFRSGHWARRLTPSHPVSRCLLRVLALLLIRLLASMHPRRPQVAAQLLGSLLRTWETGMEFGSCLWLDPSSGFCRHLGIEGVSLSLSLPFK